MENEPLIRLGCFFGILALMGLWGGDRPPASASAIQMATLVQ